MWGNLLYTTRKQELGGNAFHSLSLRLATSGQLAEGVANAERAIELYRELVSLAPVHLPTLASSLQIFASLLWKKGRRDESIDACEESVDIIRKVSHSETHFLAALGRTLDQLVEYLLEKGDEERASAAASEASEIRAKIKLLPPQPESIFLKVEPESSEKNDKDEDEDEVCETATESDGEHSGHLRAEVVVSEESPTSVEMKPEPSGLSRREDISLAPQVATSSVVVLVEAPPDLINLKPTKTSNEDILGAQHQITRTVIFLGISVAVLSVLVGILSVGFTLLWLRV
ncbi:hypothetical protein B0H11DRAFT_1988915, partial [Mycena galericulata]